MTVDWRHPYYRYKHQLGMAKKRGIPWHFTYESWWDWWEAKLGPLWYHKRGRRKGQYVMARKGDAGPYSPENVECITVTTNAKDKKRNNTCAYGSSHGNAKLDETKVRAIYTATDCTYAIAIRFNINHQFVRSIRDGRSWLRATQGLKPGSCVCRQTRRRCLRSNI